MSSQSIQQQLSPLVGEWRMESSLGPSGGVRAHASFEWVLGGQFLLERSEIDVPEAPDGLCVIARDPATGNFTQHYFDSRGVVRLYAMTFDDGVWTLLRETPDFTPLDFAQRYIGRLSDDGTAIRGRWEIRQPDATGWEKDFDLDYVRES
jgi:hypothetical protein